MEFNEREMDLLSQGLEMLMEENRLGKWTFWDEPKQIEMVALLNKLNS